MLKHSIISLISRLGYVVKRRRPGIQRSNLPPAKTLSPDDLMEALHVTNIYEGFDYEEVGADLQGWGSDSGAFASLIAKIKPDLIIEVGTWKGGSAITMAQRLKAQGKGKVLCIDTWLGAIEMWYDHSDPERYLSLKCKHGFPQIYYTFLSNVCHSGLQDYIIPVSYTHLTLPTKRIV